MRNSECLKLKSRLKKVIYESICTLELMRLIQSWFML